MRCFVRSLPLLVQRLVWVATLVGLVHAGPVFAAESLPVMVERLLAANQLPAELVQEAKIEPNDELNAYTNGYKVVVTSGLWNRLRTNDERAFVVSHEVAHIALQHIEKTTYRKVGLGLLSRFIGAATQQPLLGTAGSLGLQLIDRKFDRNQEYQADDLGLQLMKKAGYRPQAALGVFQVLDQASANGRPPEFLLTHPIPQNRIENLVRKHGVQRSSQAQPVAPTASLFPLSFTSLGSRLTATPPVQSSSFRANQPSNKKGVPSSKTRTNAHHQVKQSTLQQAIPPHSFCAEGRFVTNQVGRYGQVVRSGTCR